MSVLVVGVVPYSTAKKDFALLVLSTLYSMVSLAPFIITEEFSIVAVVTLLLASWFYTFCIKFPNAVRVLLSGD